jgi:hypothetical protein
MWFRRTIRLMGWGRNPLRRRSDRIEGWLSVLFLGVMFVIGPWAASHAAHAVYRDDLRATAWERQHRFRVDAVLVRDARPDPHDSTTPPPENVPTVARWTGRDATVHTGTVYVPEGSRAGTVVRIWINDQSLVSVPPGRRSPRMDAGMAAVLLLGGIAGGLAGIRRVIRWQLDRRRLRAWQLEWMMVGPGWTRQR